MADNLQSKIRERAYQLWEQEGRLHGRDLDHWLRAERAVTGEGGAAASRPRKTASRAGKGQGRPRRKAAAPADME